MPRYEYRCRACGDTFEVSRPMRDADAPSTCPQGHADTVKLLLSRGARADLKDDRGMSALDMAKQAGHQPVAALLAQ